MTWSVAKWRADLVARWRGGRTAAANALDRRAYWLSKRLSLLAGLFLCVTPLLLHTGRWPHLERPAPSSAMRSSSSGDIETSSVAVLKTRPLTRPGESVQPAGTATTHHPRQTSRAQQPQPERAVSPNKDPGPETSQQKHKQDAPADAKVGGGSDKPPSETGKDENKAAAPTAAEPAVPETWSEAEIAEALQVCQSMSASVPAQLEALPPIRKGQCGTPAPISLRRLGEQGKGVEFSPPAILNCPMVAKLYRWLEDTLQPVARETLGASVVRMNSTSGYVCRGRNGATYGAGKISEHALANAIDIQSFTLSDGRTIDVGKHWGATERDRAKAVPIPSTAGKPGEKDASLAPPQPSKVPHRRGAIAAPVMEPAKSPAPDPPQDTVEGKFLRALHRGACKHFGTVLGPEANNAHREHFHFDLHPRRHSNYCQ